MASLSLALTFVIKMLWFEDPLGDSEIGIITRFVNLFFIDLDDTGDEHESQVVDGKIPYENVYMVTNEIFTASRNSVVRKRESHPEPSCVRNSP